MIAIFTYALASVFCFVAWAAWGGWLLHVLGWVFNALAVLTLIWIIRRDIKLGRAPWQRRRV